MFRIDRLHGLVKTSPLLALCFFSATAGAQTIPGTPQRVRLGPARLFIVDPNPSPCRFSADLQSAVNAASDGDVVLVKGGFHYFAIDGKSLCVIGVGHPGIGGAVRNLRADQHVILRGFQSQFSPVVFLDNAGPVWVEDFNMTQGMFGYEASSSTIGLFHCQLSGNRAGFSAIDSTVFAYHSSFVGLQGVDAYFDTGLCDSSGGLECFDLASTPGGVGLSMGGTGAADLFGCSVRGGDGGGEATVDCDCGSLSIGDTLPGSCGGNALGLFNATSARLLESPLTGGLPDCDGTAVSGSGAPTLLQGTTGELSVDSPVLVGTPLHYTIRGPAGRKVFLSFSSEYAPTYVPEWKGYLVVPFDAPDVFVGTLPASGQLDLTQPIDNLLEIGVQAKVIYVQAKFYNESNGALILGTPSALVITRDLCP